MPEYHKLTIKQMERFAERSSGELASLGGGRLMNYENGQHTDCLVDEDTALFIASAKNIVLELVRRLQKIEGHTEIGTIFDGHDELNEDTHYDNYLLLRDNLRCIREIAGYDD